MKVAILVAVLSLQHIADASARVECEPQRVHDGAYWSYRLIDGRQCWFRGKYRSKQELYWQRDSTPKPAPVREERPEGDSNPTLVVAPPTEDWHADPLDQLLAFTCC